MPPASPDRFRTAMKFSLWAWAAYWPGGGILLLAGGLNPVSIAVMLLALAGFGLLLAAGALRTTASRELKEFLIERPIYLIAALIVLALVAPMMSAVENIGLALFASFYLASMVLAIWRLHVYVKSTGQGIRGAKADQAFLLLGLMAMFAFFVFFDSVTQMFGALPLGFDAPLVAITSWVNLFYPPLLLLATRGIREPLRWSIRKPKIVVETEGRAIGNPALE